MAAWCGLIFHLSGIPDLSSGLEYDYVLRKLAHMAEYAVLYALTRRALHGTRPEPLGRWEAVSACFSVVYAMSDEYHQTFVAGRRGAWSDVGIDAAGVAFAAGWAWWRSLRRPFSPLTIL